MKEIIIVAGKNKFDVGWLRRGLRERRYNSIPCRTTEKIIEELEILPTCDVCVPLVIIEPQILCDISEDLIARLSECALEVPFVLFGEPDAQDDLMEVFEKICEYRMRFRPEQSPALAGVLEEAGIKVTCP